MDNLSSILNPVKKFKGSNLSLNPSSDPFNINYPSLTPGLQFYYVNQSKILPNTNLIPLSDVFRRVIVYLLS